MCGASLRGRPAAASFAFGRSSVRRGGLRATKPSVLGLRAQQQPGAADEKDAAEGKNAPIDLELLGRQFEVFKKIAKPYFEEEKNARVLIAIVLTFTFLNAGISVGFSYLSRDFWTALNSKDSEVFYPLLTKYAFFLAAGTPVGVLYKYYREKLSIQWRSWITKRILDTYEADRNYYILESTSNIDNPDQRMAEDLRSFTQVSLAFAISFVTSVIDLFSFSTILWSIYPPLWGAILVYAGFGTAGTLLIGNKLVGLNFEQLQREADFRFSLIRVRENAESIAFYGGEQIEMREIKRRLDKTIDNAIRLVGQQRNLEFFTTGYRYMVQIVPSIVVAPLYFQSKIELGVVSQSYGAFNHILNDLSIIINQFENIASFGAGIGRLGDFVDAMKISAERQERLVQQESGRNTTAFRTTWEETSWLDAFKEAISVTGISPADPTPLRVVLDRAVKELVPLSLDAPFHEAPRPKPSFFTFADTPPAHAGGEAVHAGSETHAGAETASGKDVVVGGVRDVGEITSTELSGTPLRVEGLRLFTPDGSRELLRDLDLEMQPGQHLLIVGDSGAGKSSLLRAVAGLWSTGSGHITRPPPGETFFLPQRPYCTLGTLREQLLYPAVPAAGADEGGGGDGGQNSLGLTDAQLLDILDKVRLPDLASRLAAQDGGSGLDSKRDWSAMLSLGEQQRLAFGRLLANRPRLAILDEASSALDLESERAMYSLLEEQPDLTYISVGHRPSLLDYHDTKLRLRKSGYSVETIEEGDRSRNSSNDLVLL